MEVLALEVHALYALFPLLTQHIHSPPPPKIIFKTNLTSSRRDQYQFMTTIHIPVENLVVSSRLALWSNSNGVFYICSLVPLLNIMETPRSQLYKQAPLHISGSTLSTS